MSEDGFHATPKRVEAEDLLKDLQGFEFFAWTKR
jgi:hypothetical protein